MLSFKNRGERRNAMKVYRSAYAKTNADSAVALGCFDGVHIGHTQIIKATSEEAKKSRLCSVVWSFQAPPKSFFSKEPAIITPLPQKRRIIKDLGADMLISTQFNEKIASLSPEKFFEDILIGCLRAKHIFCGFNYRFGKGGKGDVGLLYELCEKFDIKLTVFEEIKLDGISVSSSAIRSYLLSGDVESAQKMLGRPYGLKGKVKDGQRLGRTLGFPTVNQSVPQNCLPIKNGVYLTKVKFEKKTRYGITNIGMRPTVNGKERVAETNIFDFCGDLYGKYVTVEFVKFIRAETKFSSLDELKNQVNKDIETAKEIIKNNSV